MLTILVRETGFDYFTFALRHSGDAFSVLSCGRPTREPLRRAFCNPAECARPDGLACFSLQTLPMTAVLGCF